jgi:sugar/nucleoside kinase (ribokinase family)
VTDAPYDVIGFGVNTLDLTALIDGFPSPDSKQPMLELALDGGGMTATALVACARLGLRTRYVGKAGGDLWARLALRALRREGVDVGHVLRDRTSPGHVSLVLVDRRSAARTIVFRRPAAYAVRPEELDRAALTAGRLLHVDGVDAPAAEQAIRWAREAGMRVTMDGDRVVEGTGRVWPLADVLVCNPRFVQLVTGRPTVEDGLVVLASRGGPSRVAATLGAEGAVGLDGGRWCRAPGFPVDAVDTNGAGDVFHGACAFGELRGWPLEWTLIFASAVAAMKCRALGGRRGIPRLPEVAQFLERHGHGAIARAAA